MSCGQTICFFYANCARFADPFIVACQVKLCEHEGNVFFKAAATTSQPRIHDDCLWGLLALFFPASLHSHGARSAPFLRSMKGVNLGSIAYKI